MTPEAHPIPDAALDGDIAVLGRKGGGKTFTSKGIVERLLDMGRRVLVLDPLGVWAGLRTGADGESPGYPVGIFGGLHGDLPLDPAAAVALADVIARENLPAVLDLSELSKSAQQSFLSKFLAELRRVNREALTIVLEEADVFAPQNPTGDDSKLLHSEIDWIARRGRFRGFRLITITQRPARLSKDVLTQANCLIMHRLPAPQDRDAAKEWVDGNGDRSKSKIVFDTLAGLPVGEAWVLAQDPPMLERARFPVIKTLDTSSTPKAGEKRTEPKTLAQVDIGPIRAALAGARPAEPPKRDTLIAPDPRALAAAETRGYERGLVEGRERGWREAWASVEAQARDAQRGHLGQVAVAAQDAVAPTPKDKRPQPAPRPELSSDIGAERRPLAVLASAYPAGMTEAQWAVAAGMKRTGGTWQTYRSRLKTAGRIEWRESRWFATDRGLADAGQSVEPMPEPGLTLVAFWADRISGVGPMLRALAAHYPGWITKEDLASELSMTASGGTFQTYVSRLRSSGLLDADDVRRVRLTQALMERSRAAA